MISRSDLQQFVVHLRQRGVKPVTCNTWLRALNAFCRWLHEEGELPTLVKLAPQRLEKKLIATHGEAALRALLTFRAKDLSQRRVHALVLTILDTGCRIEELLTARKIAFDFDNLLLMVTGKGRKDRRVPFSTELRRVLYRFDQVKQRAQLRSELMFPARDGGRWEHRNALRSYYCLLQRLGLPRSGFHRLRHTFVTQYLKNGGDVVRLSIILGHSEISTTMKYLHLLTETRIKEYVVDTLAQTVLLRESKCQVTGSEQFSPPTFALRAGTSIGKTIAYEVDEHQVRGDVVLVEEVQCRQPIRILVVAAHPREVSVDPKVAFYMSECPFDLLAGFTSSLRATRCPGELGVIGFGFHEKPHGASIRTCDPSIPVVGLWRSFWMAILPGLPLLVAGWSVVVGYGLGVSTKQARAGRMPQVVEPGFDRGFLLSRLRRSVGRI